MKSGNLNFLEPSGPFQACNGTALPLPLLQLTKKIGGRLAKGAEKLVAFRRHSTSSFSTGKSEGGFTQSVLVKMRYTR